MISCKLHFILKVFLIGVLFISGCGYSPGYKLPRGVTRVSIPIFKNETIPFRRDLEYELTRAVKREFQLLTTAEIVPREDSNAILRGSILRFDEGVLVESSAGDIQEAGIMVQVGIQLIRSRDQRVLLQRVVEGLTDCSRYGDADCIRDYWIDFSPRRRSYRPRWK